MFLFTKPLPESEYVHTQNHLIIIDTWQNRIFRTKHLLVYVLPKGEFIGQSDNQRCYKFSYEFVRTPYVLAERVLRVYMGELKRFG
jgi:hypothetical protein